MSKDSQVDVDFTGAAGGAPRSGEPDGAVALDGGSVSRDGGDEHVAAGLAGAGDATNDEGAGAGAVAAAALPSFEEEGPDTAGLVGAADYAGVEDGGGGEESAGGGELVWEEVVLADGTHYFYNHATGVSQYEEPGEPYAPATGVTSVVADGGVGVGADGGADVGADGSADTQVDVAGTHDYAGEAGYGAGAEGDETSWLGVGASGPPEVKSASAATALTDAATSGAAALPAKDSSDGAAAGPGGDRASTAKRDKAAKRARKAARRARRQEKKAKAAAAAREGAERAKAAVRAQRRESHQGPRRSRVVRDPDDVTVDIREATGGAAGGSASDEERGRRGSGVEERRLVGQGARDVSEQWVDSVMTVWWWQSMCHVTCCEGPMALLEAVVMAVVSLAGFVSFVVLSAVRKDKSLASRGCAMLIDCVAFVAAIPTLLIPGGLLLAYRDFDSERDWQLRRLPTLLGPVDARRWYTVRNGVAAFAQNAVPAARSRWGSPIYDLDMLCCIPQTPLQLRTATVTLSDDSADDEDSTL